MTDNKNIKKGAPARNPVCYQTLQDIVIPAGTILRSEQDGRFTCGVETATFSISDFDADISHNFKKVIA